MAFREGTGTTGVMEQSDLLSFDAGLQRGLGSPPRLATGEFDKLNPSQMQLLNNFMIPLIQSRMGQFDQLTSLSSLEAKALQGGEEQFESIFGEGGSATQGREAISGALANVGQNFEQFYQTNIRDVLMEDFQENIRPGTSRRFAESGFFSSERERADAADMEGLMQTLTRGRSETQLAANQQLGNLAQQSIGFESGLAGILNNLISQGGLERNLGTAEFQNLIAAFSAALGIEAIENVAIGLPGEQGGVKETGQSFMGGLGSGLGGSV